MDNRSPVRFYPVKGYSMHPLIREGDIVKVRAGAEGFKRADVMIYRSGTEVYCHRVVAKADRLSGGFMLQCDNNPGYLIFVSPVDIIGRAVALGRGTAFVSLERGRYRLFGETLVFIGRYMRWLPERLRAVKRLIRGGG